MFPYAIAMLCVALNALCQFRKLSLPVHIISFFFSIRCGHSIIIYFPKDLSSNFDRVFLPGLLT
jgi:hypothetical protein